MQSPTHLCLKERPAHIRIQSSVTLSLLTSTCSVVCLVPQVYSNRFLTAALEVLVSCLFVPSAQRKGMVIRMKNLKMKAARAGKDLSQDDLAKLTGVSRQTISAIEKGDYNPTINLCIAICRALDRTLDELFWPEQ